MDILALILLALILVFAHTVETVLGFGATLIAVALGIYVLPLDFLLPVLVILAVLQSIWLVARWFRYLRWRVLLFNILPFAAIGMVIGIFYRSRVADYVQLLILLGIFIAAVSVLEIVMIYRTRSTGGSLPWYLSWPIIIVGGIFHGIYASGGPLIVYYSSRELKEPAEFRATISMLWLILNLTLLANLQSLGQLNFEVLKTVTFMLPALILGIFLGSRVKFRAIVFKVLIYALLFVAGLLLFIQAVAGLR